MNRENFEIEPRLLELISNLQDGSLSEDDREQLNAWLKRDTQARQFYHAMMDLHVQLDQVYAGKNGLAAMPGPLGRVARGSKQDGRIKPNSRSFLWMGIAASLVVGLFLNAWTFRQREPLAQVAEEFDPNAETIIDEANGVAVLTRAIGAEWHEDMSPAYREGDALPKGSLRLEKGFTQIEFFGGATVILEGPAELELLSSDRARFIAGKLRALVPEPAQGFTVEAPSFDAVDLGTEFAMSLDPEGRAEVHVVDGEVSLQDKNGGKIENLLGGRVVQTTGQSGQFIDVSGSKVAFAGREEIAKIEEEGFRDEAEAWQLQRDRLANDPDTVVYFDFENQELWDRRLSSAKEGAPEGGIVGARWTQGRWPSKGALAFSSVNDRVRLNVPGEFDSLTFAVHLRIDGLFQRLNSLFMTDEFDSHEVHWQIRNDGALKLGIREVGQSNTKPVLSPQDMARWLHLAVVYDRKQGLVSHYVDAELVASSPITTKKSLRIGSAELGNWHAVDRDFPIRRLSGTIDEFLILKRALSGREIRELALGGEQETQ